MILPDTELKLLINEASVGNDTSFGRLYTILVPRVFAYIRSRLTDKEAALDCTQQTFIELWKALPRFKYQGDPQFYGFLFTITKRQIIKVRENLKRLPERLVEEALVPDQVEGPEDGHDLLQVIKELPEIDQDIILLHHWSAYTFGEIGEMLHSSESNIRVRHHRALKLLRTLLPHYEK